MKFPFFLFAFIIFTATLALRRKQQTKKQEDVNESFLERERRANATRKKDISNLKYLSFCTDRLPLGEHPDETLVSYEDCLRELSGKKIINLSAYSNTDLKLMYGPANLNALSEYDDNYHTLSSALLAYAKREIELERIHAAIRILEYAMSLSIDSSQIYLLLAQLYEKEQTPQKIKNIRNALSAMDESFSNPVIAKLAACHIDE